MARLPRFVVPGEAHYLILRGQDGPGAVPICHDAADQADCLAALKEASANEGVLVHAYALLTDELQLLATPPDAQALGRLVQALGRRYVSAYNRRHGRRGSLWDGRFRCALVEPGPTRLQALVLIDGLGGNDDGGPPACTSAAHRTGGAASALVRDLPEVWQLGNTPFEREARYRDLLRLGLPSIERDALRRAALGGWVAGTPAYSAQMAQAHGRPMSPRPRGRPRLNPVA